MTNNNSSSPKKNNKLVGWLFLLFVIIVICILLLRCIGSEKKAEPVVATPSAPAIKQPTAAAPVTSLPIKVTASAPIAAPVLPVAAPASQAKASKFLETAPPADFKPLLKGTDTIVDVYYGGQSIGEAEAHFTDTTIQFSDPESLVAKIPNLKNKAEVLQTLSSPLPTNSNLVCQQNEINKQPCGELTPPVAGVIFDPSIFRADLFIGSALLAPAALMTGLLPNSDADFSYVNDFSAVGSGTDAPGNNTNNYNFTSNNTWAYENARFNADMNYSNALTNNQQQQFNINQLNAAYDFSDKEVQAGIINSQGNSFVSSQTILGASFGTTMNTIVQDSSDYGSLLQIFLATPSTVNIYKDGTLLSTQRYPMGNQVLNTANLPSGAYQVTIEVIDSQGNRTQTTRFFAKTNQIPPAEYPQYYFDAGYLEQNQFVNQQVLPGFQNTALYQAGFNMRVFNPLGASVDVTGAGSYSFLTVGSYLIGNGFQIGPQAMVGTYNTIGAGIQAQTNIGAFQSTLFGREVWTKNNNNQAAATVIVNNGNMNTLASVEQNSTQGSLNLSYQIAQAFLGFNSNVTKYQTAEEIYSYGPTFRMPLYNQHSTTVDLNLAATRTQDDFEVLAQLTMFYSSPHWIHSGAIAYRNVSGADSASPPSSAIGDLATYWQNLDAAQEGVQVGVQGHAEQDADSLGSTFNYVNNYIGVNTSVTHNFAVAGNTQNTQYSAGFNSHFAYADKEAVVGGGRPGDTGVIVYITSKHPGDKFEVYVNGQIVKIVTTDHATPIFLTPFATYEIRVHDISSAFYAYDESPQTVTLYQGNIRALTWVARTKKIIYGMLAQPNGKALSTSLVKDGVGPAITDTDGSFQVEIYDDTKMLHSNLPNGQACTIMLPAITKNTDYENVGRLSCLQNAQTT